MQYHINKQHKALAAPSPDNLPAIQPTLQSVFSSTQVYSNTRHEDITDSIGDFIAMDMKPMTVVEGTSFQKMVSTLDPRYKLPSHKHFTEKVLPKKFSGTKDKVNLLILILTPLLLFL